MVEAMRALFLGAVQGLTEFFPVSSSGHLILFPTLFHWADQGLAFDTVLHLGTLAALIWFFRNDLLSLAHNGMRFGASGARARSFCLRVCVAALPALAAGYVFFAVIERWIRNTWLVAFDLAFWAIILFVADRFSSSQRPASPIADDLSVTWVQAIVVGLVQPIALLPGTSRSGITMTAGLFTGLSREAAARFSFFVSIPVTAAAGGYGLYRMTRQGIDGDAILPLFAGFFAAAVTGAFAIRFLLTYVSKHRFDPFVFYRLALALAVLLLV